MLTLTDVGRTPRTSTYKFRIYINQTFITTNITTVFVPQPNKTEISFKPDSNVGIKVN